MIHCCISGCRTSLLHQQCHRATKQNERGLIPPGTSPSLGHHLQPRLERNLSREVNNYCKVCKQEEVIGGLHVQVYFPQSKLKRERFFFFITFNFKLAMQLFRKMALLWCCWCAICNLTSVSLRLNLSRPNSEPPSHFPLPCQ